MLSLGVSVFWMFALFAKTEAQDGYNYARPEFTNHQHHSYQQSQHEDEHHPVIAYTLSNDDFNFLQQQKQQQVNHNLQYNNNYLPAQDQHNPNNNEYHTVHYQHIPSHDDVQSAPNYQAQDNFKYDHTSNQQIQPEPYQNSVEDEHYQDVVTVHYQQLQNNHHGHEDNNLESHRHYQHIEHNQNQDSHRNSYFINSQDTNQRQSAIKKSVYLHVPPADFYTTQHQATSPLITPPKKVYKIIFIKLPAQKANNQVVLEQINNLKNLVEEKTLIYVLVKKPEVQNIAVHAPSPVQSKPEVFYVKYSKNNLAQSLSQANVGLTSVEAIPDQVPLLPGLINGQAAPYNNVQGYT